MNGLRPLTLSAQSFLLLSPTLQRPAAPHKRTGKRLCFWFIAPQQAAGVRAQAGASRLSQRVYTVCAGVPFAPSREMQVRECLEVEERVVPWSWRFGWGGATPQRPVGPIGQLSDIERGSGGQGRGSRGRGGRRPRTQHPPLEDACVLATQGDEMGVVVRKPDAGHVAAVAAVHEARRLGGKEHRPSSGGCGTPLAQPTRS